MASNSFGNFFRITTFGESHGKAVGVVIDGCPAGLPLCETEIDQALALRAPGKTPFTSPRKEPDQCEILSGVFEGVTTGAPICIVIPNKDADSSKYEPIKHLLRPGHANHTYLAKYGLFDHRGGGRSSARETAARVAAGAVAKKLLETASIQVIAYLVAAGEVQAQIADVEFVELRTKTRGSPIFCPEPQAAEQMIAVIEQAKQAGDSIGGIVEFATTSLPAGLGDPIYEKLEAALAKAMLSIPASKGFEIGSGFRSAAMYGSEHNDRFEKQGDNIRCTSNNAGGILAGITTGMPLRGRVAFKPASSIRKTQDTLTIEGEKAAYNLPEGSRHDPCVAIRAVAVVEGMAALALADALLANRGARVL